jgi:hypothetical protein
VTAPPATGDGGFLAEPDVILHRIVAELEPALDPAGIDAAIRQAASSRAQRRRLAHALAGDPDLLTSGRPEGPPQVERLIRALLERGATRFLLPCCGHCGQPKNLPQRDGALRICAECYQHRRAAAEPCAVCGATCQVAHRDQQGQPRCAHCHPYDEPDPVGRVAAHITGLEPDLDPAVVATVIRQAVPQSFQHHQVLWELNEHPELLTGQAAHGSPRVNALIHALLAAGARNIIAPSCPRCGRTGRLSHQIDGVRCCRRCYDQHGSQMCSRCRRRRPVRSRTAGGDPVCMSCFDADVANHEQ